VSCDERQQGLVVHRVEKGGAMDAWNRQVVDGPKSDMALLAGDIIVGIDNEHAFQSMLSSKDKTIMMLEVLRPACRSTSCGHADVKHVGSKSMQSEEFSF
jgi:hypothetical protein